METQKKQEILGLIFLFAGVIIAISLISFRPSDPTIFKFSPGNLEIKNWMGLFGAHLAWLLFVPLGFSSFFIPLAFLALSMFIFRKNVHIRFWYILIPPFIVITTCAGFSLVSKTMTFHGQKVSSGGKVGELVAGKMVEFFSYPGAVVIVVAMIIFFLVLITPYSFVDTFVKVFTILSLGPKKIIAVLALMSAKIKGFRKKNPDEERPIPPTTQLPDKPLNIVGNKQADAMEDAISELFASKSAPIITAPPTKSSSPPSPQLRQPADLKETRGSFKVLSTFNLPTEDLLDIYEAKEAYEDSKILHKKAEVLMQKLADFGIQGEVVNILPGPVITMFEYVPAPGIKISRIVNLSNDLTMALKALSIRIVAPIPGKAAVGIEIPNANRELVSIRSIIESAEFRKATTPLTIALGKDTTGLPVVTNLAKMPHLLIAGATGTGKSVCLNAILTSLLFRNTPESLKLLLIDPKRIELSLYEGIPHLIHPVVTDVKKATKALHWAVEEMERRYEFMASENARNIESYNRKILEDVKARNNDEAIKPFPYLVIIIDELADLMMIASREVEESITRLAQMARAAGIHLVLATQRPSVDVITGLIKANIPSRISFQVSSKIDSRTILDMPGAESLLGSGDMLFLPPGTAKLQRIHGAFISDREVQKITEFWKEQALAVGWESHPIDLSEESSSMDLDDDAMDEKYEEAVKIVLETRQASISMLQRRLRVGYNRAARMIELMEKQGIVGPSDGIKPREVLMPPK